MCVDMRLDMCMGMPVPCFSKKDLGMIAPKICDARTYMTLSLVLPHECSPDTLTMTQMPKICDARTDLQLIMARTYGGCDSSGSRGS